MKHLGSITPRTKFRRIQELVAAAPPIQGGHGALIDVNGASFKIWRDGQGTFGCEKVRDPGGRGRGMYHKTAEEMAKFLETIADPSR